MSSSQRKENSEAFLRRNAIVVNASLPMIESEEEVELRTPKEVKERLVALWAVAGTAFLRDNFFRQYFTENQLTGWLSTQERDYLLSDNRTDRSTFIFRGNSRACFFSAGALD